MTRPKSLQVHVSFELAERVRSAAERRDISVSEWIRSLLQQACDEDDLNVGLSTWLKRLNHHSVFTMVGVDALLSGHVDHGLRGRAHEAYVRRCEQLCSATITVTGRVASRKMLPTPPRASWLFRADGLAWSRAVGEAERQPVRRHQSWPPRLQCPRWLPQSCC